MCVECWEKEGSPATWNEQVKRAVELIEALYTIHPTGGPLHSVIDDYNLAGAIEPYYNGWSDTDLDAPYFEGRPIAGLPPEAPAVTEGLGRSTRQICDELATLLNAMPEQDRIAAVARHDGFICGRWAEA